MNNYEMAIHKMHIDFNSVCSEFECAPSGEERIFGSKSCSPTMTKNQHDVELHMILRTRKKQFPGRN